MRFPFVQLYIDRQKALKKEKEQKLWSVLNYCYMTEESEFENDEGELEIHQHKLPWRSTSRESFISYIYIYTCTISSAF